MNEKAEDKFESGIFWELYKDLERQFENFLEYVPYLPENEETLSFKLLNLILSIGGHIDSAFKEMARYPEFSNNDKCREILQKLRESELRVRKGKAPITISISLPLEAFEKEYKLSTRKVILKRLPGREVVIPFKTNDEGAIPNWWKVYNGLKHDVSINIREANLQNTLHALAGAFLLNVIHIPAYLRLLEYQIVKREDGHSYGELKNNWKEKLKDFIRKGKWFGILETQLFVYDYRQMEEKYE